MKILLIEVNTEPRAVEIDGSLIMYNNGPVDKSKNSAETHSGSSRTVNLEIAKDGTYHPLEV